MEFQCRNSISVYNIRLNLLFFSPKSSSCKDIPVSSDKWSLEDFKQTLCSLVINDVGLFG